MSNLPVSTADLNENVEQLRSAIVAAQAQGDPKTVVALQKKLGQAYLDAGDAPQALTEFNEAIKLVSTGEEKEVFAQLLGLRGLALKLIGNYSLALHAFRKSHTLALEIQHSALACDALIQVAALQAEMGKHEEALVALYEALKVAVEHKDRVRKMRIYGLLGDNYFQRANPTQAAEHYQKAQLAAQDLGSRAAECSFITKLGNVFLWEGKSEPAIEKYERALQLASALEDRNAEINILGGLFRAHALAREIHIAQVYGEQAIHLAAQIEHVEAELVNLQALVVFLLEQGQIDAVFPLLERGLQLTHEQTDLGMQMEFLNLRGQAFSLQEKYAEALTSWNTALTLASNLQDEVFMAKLFGRMAAILAETGDLENSVDCAEKALALAHEIADHQLAAEQQILLAFNFRDLHQNEKAVQSCRAAIETFQSLSNNEMVAQVQGLLAELEN
jgi:tetratricopeptide (TPR) repeat protein